MSYLAASVRARLLNRARAESENFGLVLTRYGIERLLTALAKAELVATLAGEGPFTVFAPTDDAFAAALESLGITAEELLARQDLAAILTYHVVAGRLEAADVIAATEAAPDGVAEIETINGAPISVTVEDGRVIIDGTATVTAVDLGAENGVVHVIDAVLLPPAD